MSLVKALYEPHVLPARARLSTHPALRTLLDPEVEPALLERFFLQLNSLGVYMTEPVDKWIRRAGQRCLGMDLGKLGQALLTHAKHEAGHHRLMVDDVRYLVRRWNARRRPPLEVERLLSQHPTDAMRAYRQLHEDTINGELPAGQVAIELEIENLSVVLGPQLLEQVERVLGGEHLAGLSVLKEHVEQDVGHTALNQRMMEDLLAVMPESAPELGEIGARALDIYLRFLADCLELSEAGTWGPAAAVA
jgi:hypothetical protein